MDYCYIAKKLFMIGGTPYETSQEQSACHYIVVIIRF